ncbi:pentatricopeptide repeat-containing protein mitochondrial-like [Trifolium pratense]|uniref:Pentatricopeptide repeat-containing protein mitochondrial-like n=1 Tax=Trifolium pratense TaxID=57577 RepID=A0A2K3NY76_TRIPR|nr:pentatricopeptide repeat-containing protein mitochondrial-like [Trifolium pratense]
MKKGKKKQSNRRFSKLSVHRFFPVLSGLTAYPVQKPDQTAAPPVPGPTGRFGPVFETLTKGKPLVIPGPLLLIEDMISYLPNLINMALIENDSAPLLGLGPNPTHEASKVFEHLVSLGVKPNAKSYSVLVDAHLINRDVKSALAVIDDMISAGFEPMRGTLKKVRRRCIRESDYESDQRLESLSRSFNYRLGSEARRNMLFNLDYSMEMA